MKTTYIKTKQNTASSFFSKKWMWKVTENTTLFVTKDSIETEEHECFYDQVSFIKNTLCKPDFSCEGAEEITQSEFDAFFTNTVSKINAVSAV